MEYNGATSSDRIFRAGLPQSSVLSPTLNTLCAADLVSTLKLAVVDVFTYADDTTILASLRNIKETKINAQKGTDDLQKWANKWKINIAPEKPQLLVLSQCYKDVKTHIHVSVEKITPSQSIIRCNPFFL